MENPLKLLKGLTKKKKKDPEKSFTSTSPKGSKAKVKVYKDGSRSVTNKYGVTTTFKKLPSGATVQTTSKGEAPSQAKSTASASSSGSGPTKRYNNGPAKRKDPTTTSSVKSGASRSTAGKVKTSAESKGGRPRYKKPTPSDKAASFVESKAGTAEGRGVHSNQGKDGIVRPPKVTPKSAKKAPPKRTSKPANWSEMTRKQRRDWIAANGPITKD